jgi:hypothetical protein
MLFQDNPYGAITEAELLEMIRPAPLLADTWNAWADTLDLSDHATRDRLYFGIWMQAVQLVTYKQSARRGRLHGEAMKRGGGHIRREWVEDLLGQPTKAGVSPYFLVAALRIALDSLIAANLPDALESWRQIADARLPHGALFWDHPEDQKHGPVTYSPATEEE